MLLNYFSLCYNFVHSTTSLQYTCEAVSKGEINAKLNTIKALRLGNWIMDYEIIKKSTQSTRVVIYVCRLSL